MYLYFEDCVDFHMFLPLSFVRYHAKVYDAFVDVSTYGADRSMANEEQCLKHSSISLLLHF